MSPADEATCIARWQAGTETVAIAAQLGIPPGTVSSRASALQCQGKIQPRPRGGAYPKQKAQGRLASNGTPAPQVPPAVPMTPHPPR